MVALFSLGLLLPFAPGADKRFQHQARSLEAARALIEAGDYPEASQSLRKFLQIWGDTPDAAEAEYLLGKSMEGEIRKNSGPTASQILKIIGQYQKAEDLGYEPSLVKFGILRIANLLREKGFYGDAEGVYQNQLISQRGYWEAHLDFARSLSLEAKKSKNAKMTGELLKKSREHLGEYLKKAGGRDQVEALLLQTHLHWQQNQFSEMEKIALLAIPDVMDTPYLADFYLQWGKAKSRQKQIPKALELLRIARDLAQTAKIREESTYFETELRLAELDGRGEFISEKLSKENTHLMPLLYLLLGRYRLETGGREPFSLLKAGLEMVPDANTFSDLKPDMNGLWERLLREAEKAKDSGSFNTVLGLLEEYHRIFPGRIDYLLATANLKMKRGNLLAREAAAIEKVDPTGAEKIRREANRLLYSAGKTFEVMADHADSTPDFVKSSQWAAANAFFAGQQYAKAAEWFRRHYLAQPEENRESLFREGEALMYGRLYEAESRGEPGALRTFAEYLMEAGPTAPRTPQVIIYRGRMFLELGKPLEAVRNLRPLLRESQFDLDPRDPEWGEALLLKGLAHMRMTEQSGASDVLRRGARMDASRDLKEYMERFSKGIGFGDTPPVGVLEASFALSRIATQEKRWGEATDRLLDMLQLSSAIPSRVRVSQDTSLRRAHFLLGDLYLNQGKNAEALRAYEKAAQKFATSEDRLWGLVGRARTLIRMGDAKAAREAVEKAKSTYGGHPELFNESMDGRGLEYWPSALKELEAELQEGITLNAR